MTITHRNHTLQDQCDAFKSLDATHQTDPDSPLHHNQRCPLHSEVGRARTIDPVNRMVGQIKVFSIEADDIVNMLMFGESSEDVWVIVRKAEHLAGGWVRIEGLDALGDTYLRTYHPTTRLSVRKATA